MSDNKVIGIPVNKYAKLCYMLILVSSAFGVLTALLGLAGIYLGFGGLFSLMGLIGMALAVTGWLAFTEEFNEIDLSHFKFLSALFVVLFVLGIILFNGLGGMGFVAALVMLIYSTVQFAILFASYKTWEGGTKATIESVKASLLNLKQYIPKK